ncbi:MAG: hypothetical protein E4H16_02750 [Candidatus Atribacteria bacterium]|nr:MAG: hypothetical protein E4H16_02750 [Candidatus Atribacteria bacterium]
MAFDITSYLPLLYTLLSGVFWSGTGYITNTTFETFDGKKLIATLITSVVAVFTMMQVGIDVTQASFEVQMVTYYAMTAIFYTLLNKIFRKADVIVQTVRIRRQTVDTQDVQYTAKFASSDEAPAEVKFIDMIGNITLWDFDDGVLARPDPGQREILHIYRMPGVYNPAAIAGKIRVSNITVKVLDGILPLPSAKKSWHEVIFAWLKSLFGLK